MSDLGAAVRAASSRDLPRAELAAAIVARLGELGAPAESIAAARRIAEPRSVVVVAGQQPVLLGGPGLVWAKAVDAIALARAIGEQHDVPAIAVFWNASEDHDHAECGHVRMDLGSEVETLSVPLPNDRRMLAGVAVPPEARALLAMLQAKFPQGPSRDEVLAAVEPAADDTMGSWFSRILLRLLGRHGLVVVEPQTLRPFAKTVMEFELTRPGELAASIRRAEEDAVAAGEEKSLDLARDELFFFVGSAGRRVRVTRKGDTWHVDEGVLTTAQMRALPAGAFSWNVAARVLAQDVALPVVVQVCGPSEIRYCRRLAPAHAVLGAPVPLLAARTNWTFEPARVRRLERDLGVSWADFAVKTSPGSQGEAAPEEPEAVRRLREIVASLPANGSAAVQRRRSSLVQAVDGYADALRGDAAERDRVRADRLRRLLAVMLPEGEGQDRRLSPLSWFAANGLARLDAAVRSREDPPFMTSPEYFTRRPVRAIVDSPNRGAET